MSLLAPGLFMAVFNATVFFPGEKENSIAVKTGMKRLGNRSDQEPINGLLKRHDKKKTSGSRVAEAQLLNKIYGVEIPSCLTLARSTVFGLFVPICLFVFSFFLQFAVLYHSCFPWLLLVFNCTIRAKHSERKPGRLLAPWPVPGPLSPRFFARFPQFASFATI